MSKNQLNEDLERLVDNNRNSNVDSLNIVNIGGIGSGKTTILHRVHHYLGYHKAGVPIYGGGEHKARRSVIAKRRRSALEAFFVKYMGFRKGATSTWDSTALYGITEKGRMIKFNFVSAAGHAAEVYAFLYTDGWADGANYAFLIEKNNLILPKSIDGILYLIDGDFMKNILKHPSQLSFEEFMRSSDIYRAVSNRQEEQWGGITIIHGPGDAPELDLHKGDGLYSHLRSLIIADKVVLNQDGDIPLIGLKTHESSKADVNAAEIREFQLALNNALDEYLRSLGDLPDLPFIHKLATQAPFGYDVYPEIPRPKYQNMTLIDVLRARINDGVFDINHRLEFTDHISDWRNIDLMHYSQKVEVVRIVYDMCKSVLENKGINTDHFKLITFSNSPLYDEMAINYRNL